jgi:hypothetical protein
LNKLSRRRKQEDAAKEAEMKTHGTQSIPCSGWKESFDRHLTESIVFCLTDIQNRVTSRPSAWVQGKIIQYIGDRMQFLISDYASKRLTGTAS